MLVELLVQRSSPRPSLWNVLARWIHCPAEAVRRPVQDQATLRVDWVTHLTPSQTDALAQVPLSPAVEHMRMRESSAKQATLSHDRARTKVRTLVGICPLRSLSDMFPRRSHTKPEIRHLCRPGRRQRRSPCLLDSTELGFRPCDIEGRTASEDRSRAKAELLPIPVSNSLVETYKPCYGGGPGTGHSGEQAQRDNEVPQVWSYVPYMSMDHDMCMCMHFAR